MSVDKKNNPFRSIKSRVRALWVFPRSSSFLLAIAFFVLYLSVFRPGYQVDDDITMIQMVSGYLGGQPAPFMVFSNVLLGFFLNILYRLPTNLNWEILLFFGIHFLSVWFLVYIILSLQVKAAHKFIGILVVLLSDSLFLLNITFTTTAAFAVLSGFLALLAATHGDSQIPRRLLFFGGALILAGSLIRLESFLLVLLLTLPPLAVIHRLFKLKSLLLASGITIFVVGAFYAFNLVYIRLFPEWDSFYAYNDVRSQIQDTPRARLSNMKDLYTGVGWNFNDYRLFMSWFFPDEKLYSISNLNRLAASVPGTERNLFGAALSYFYPRPYFNDIDSFPYFFMIAAGLIALMVYPEFKRAVLPVIVLLPTFLVLIFYLIWTEKVPLRVWDSFLVVTCVLGLFIFLWTAPRTDALEREVKDRNAVKLIVPLFLGAATLSALYYAVVTTRLNVQRQIAYQKVLFDLRTLQTEGKIPNQALIVAPAMGIPLVWSNPMFLDLPAAQYLEMGWLTFSPSYYNVLQKFGVQSLPAGFYQNENVYLMVKANLRDSVIEYFADHEHLVISPQLVYSSPNYNFDPDYNNVRLYKLVLRK